MTTPDVDRPVPDAAYAEILRWVPIVCADVLLSPVGRGHDTIGLIRRGTYGGQGPGWCLVGGAVNRDEPVVNAVARHVRMTLGRSVRIEPGTLEFRTVAEYFTDPRPGQLHDPRKHAVALTFVAECTGDPEPADEALDFAWFDRDRIPEIHFGFGQGAVVDRVLLSARQERPAGPM